MLDFGALPPEINSGRMYAGPGAGSMLAAAAAWNGLAAELQSAASSYGSVISALTSGPWLGPSSTAMAAAAAPYVAWMGATAGQAELAATQAQAAAAAYAAAFAATVSPPEIAANRAQLMTLVCDQLIRSEHAGDRGHRGPIRRNVGPGRRGDVRLCREFGGNHREGDAVHRGAADHQHGRVGRAGDRGCPDHRHVDWRGRAVNAVTADLHGSNRATESRVALILRVGREFVLDHDLDLGARRNIDFVRVRVLGRRSRGKCGCRVRLYPSVGCLVTDVVIVIDHARVPYGASLMGTRLLNSLLRSPRPPQPAPRARARPLRLRWGQGSAGALAVFQAWAVWRA